MRWPFRRRKPAAEAAQPRPHREWARLAPLAPVGLRPEPEVASALGFQSRLATRWQQPPILEPLGHEVNLSAPPGLTSNIVAPVQGYSNAPDLPVLPVAGPLPFSEEEQKPFIRYERPQRTAVPVAEPDAAAPAREPRSVAAEDLPPRVAPLVGEPLVAPRTPVAESPLEEDSPLAEEPHEPPLAEEPLRAPAPTSAVEDLPPRDPLPAEPPPRVRRLGRIGAPLHVDAIPPAVLRAPMPSADPAAPGPVMRHAESSSAAHHTEAAFRPPAPDLPQIPDVVRRHAESMGAPPVDAPARWASAPDDIPDVVRRHAESMGAPPPDEPQPFQQTPSPAELGVPDWFRVAPTDADPDDPVSASWAAPAQPEPGAPGLPSPPVVTPGESLFSPRSPAAPPSDVERPVRPFRRFGVGPPVEAGTEPSQEEPPSEPPPPARSDPATPADDPPQPPDLPPAAFDPAALDPATFDPRAFAPELFTASPAFEPSFRPSIEPPQVEDAPPPMRHVQAESFGVRAPAASRPLASVQRTLAYLPPAGMSVLPGLTARPEPSTAPAEPASPAGPQPEQALPSVEEPRPAPFLNLDVESPVELPPGVTPWAGYPPPAPHLDDVLPTPDLSSLFGVPTIASPVEDAPPRAPRTDWDPEPMDQFAAAVPDQVFDEPDQDETDERLDGLAADLYDRIRDRLRRELLVDRERSLMITDWR